MPEYKCPHGCVTQYPITTLRGWKRHMSVKHGRFSDSELQQAVAQAQGDETNDVATRMANFAQEIDGVPVEILPDGGLKEKPVEVPTEPTPVEPTMRKVRATPRHLTRVISGIPERILNAFNIQPDNDDQKAIEEASDFLQDIFGVDFEVDEKKTTIRSRWWAFAWVGGVIALVVAKHMMPNILQMLRPKEQEPFKDATAEK